jgi:hypothetical protein
MEKVWILSLICCTLLSACGGQEAAPTPSPEPPPVDAFALPTERGEYFATSGVCSTCHKDMLDGEGHDVSIDTYWRGTMMANSSRDPYWQASVRAEVISNPDYNEIIQDKCTTCHTPMARTTRTFTGDTGVLLDNGFLDTQNDLHILALDGISCTLCHQIKDQLLGDEDSFDGGYVIDSTKSVGERINFGPYDVADESVVLMRSASGFVPEQSKHIQTAEFCGVCHTLYTPTVDNNGEVAGLFPEQMPYIEWLASAYVDQQSCQDCHMPEAPGEVVLSVTQSPGRSQFSKHAFAGGNTYGLQLLRVYGEDMGVTATTIQIDAALDRAKTQLQDQTAQVLIQNATIAESILEVDVFIDSQVGHKFPSGFPSRRVWIHLVVQDANGVVIFESGKWDSSGGISGNQNDLDDTAFEPHYQVIDNPEQVQIYEAIMGDVNASVTTTLLRGAVYLKDNRLLPSGFDKDQVSDDIGVYGNALDDPDFQGGSDMLHYQVSIDPAVGPFTVTAELLYQSIGYRWAKNLSRFGAPEPELFLSYYSTVPNLPVLVSGVTLEVDG